ncbi:MAG: Hsp70 family protein [Lentisphaerae bacterium]|nr:Hsp70 family protein [Lentisphaerota bacterium]
MSGNRRIVLGIDLGTTYSAVAYVNEAGKVEKLRNSRGEYSTPSVVFFDEGKRVIVGQEAKEMAPVYPEEVASFIKRYMGDDSFFFQCRQGKLRPEEISSYILKKLVKDAEDELGQEIKDVVITCPAYFFVKEREATRLAGELAGLNVVQIINEPTAAAIAYGMTNSDDEEKNVLVYDLGGGTFDVTMIQFKKGRIEVICTGGDHHLGGKDWDDALVLLLIQKFQEETGNDDNLLEKPEALQDLLGLAEHMKKQLSFKTTGNGKFTYEGMSVKLCVTREEFETVTQDLLGRTLEFTDAMLKDAQAKGIRKFDELLLVGGSTLMPMVSQALKAKYGMTPKSFDPGFAVATGAAIVGNNAVLREALEEQVKKLTRNGDFSLEGQGSLDEFTLDAAKRKLQDDGYSLTAIDSALTEVVNVASKSFGVVCRLRQSQISRLFNLIYRNTALPVSVAFDCATPCDNAQNITFTVLENSMSLPADEKSRKEVAACGIDPACGVQLWSDKLMLPPGLPAGEKMKVIFNMNKEGLLDVTCLHEPSKRSIHNVIKTVPVFSEAEKNQMADRLASLVID